MAKNSTLVGSRIGPVPIKKIINEKRERKIIAAAIASARVPQGARVAKLIKAYVVRTTACNSRKCAPNDNKGQAHRPRIKVALRGDFSFGDESPA